MEEQVKDQAPEYEAPRVVDYGTLVELTRISNQANSDSPAGTPNTAFPVAS
jgi:hypothetical protein